MTITVQNNIVTKNYLQTSGPLNCRHYNLRWPALYLYTDRILCIILHDMAGENLSENNCSIVWNWLSLMCCVCGQYWMKRLCTSPHSHNLSSKGMQSQSLLFHLPVSQDNEWPLTLNWVKTLCFILYILCSEALYTLISVLSEMPLITFCMALLISITSLLAPVIQFNNGFEITIQPRFTAI